MIGAGRFFNRGKDARSVMPRKDTQGEHESIE